MCDIYKSCQLTPLFIRGLQNGIWFFDSGHDQNRAGQVEHKSSISFWYLCNDWIVCCNDWIDYLIQHLITKSIAKLFWIYVF